MASSASSSFVPCFSRIRKSMFVKHQDAKHETERWAGENGAAGLVCESAAVQV